MMQDADFRPFGPIRLAVSCRRESVSEAGSDHVDYTATVEPEDRGDREDDVEKTASENLTSPASRTMSTIYIPQSKIGLAQNPMNHSLS